MPDSKSTPRPESSGFSEEMIQNCLEVMASGNIENLFEILPRIGVLRDKRFRQPLIDLLAQKKDPKRREFAAYAMGSMGDHTFLGALKQVFLESCAAKSSGLQDLQIAVIEAIGVLGDDAAAEFFLPILTQEERCKNMARMRKWIVESLGAIAQQGGSRSLEVLVHLLAHKDPDLRAQSLSEISVAFWHRPNEIGEGLLKNICDLTRDRNPVVAESALAALESLADVGCRRAEEFFSDR